jgi:Mrr N-terminal domain
MAVPVANAYVDLVLAVLGDGQAHSLAELRREAPERLQGSAEDQRDPVSSNQKMRHSAQEAVVYLVQAGFAERTPEGLIRITSHGRAALASPDRPKRRPSWIRLNKLGGKLRSNWVLLGWFVASAILAGVFFWLGHDTTPTRPAFPDGGILVFVDAPKAQVDINFVADTQGDFSVSVSGAAPKEPQQPFHFLVIASGSAVVDTTYPTNTEYQSGFTRGDWIRTLGLNWPDGSPFTAAWQNRSEWGNYSFIRQEDTYKIYGYVGGRDVTTAFAYLHGSDPWSWGRRPVTVYGKLRNSILSSAGSVELGQLPLIGTAPFATLQDKAESERVTQELSIDGPITLAGNPDDVSTGYKWYVPAAKVNISINSDHTVDPNPDALNNHYPLLPSGVKLDSAAPATVESNELLWHQKRPLKGVTWDLTNQLKAQQASVWLFWSGILFGIAASFLGVLFDRLVKSRPEVQQPPAAQSGGQLERRLAVCLQFIH